MLLGAPSRPQLKFQIFEWGLAWQERTANITACGVWTLAGRHMLRLTSIFCSINDSWHQRCHLVPPGTQDRQQHMKNTALVAERDTPRWIFTRNADKIPWSASSFSSSLSSSCRTPKMYAPYTSRSTSNESSRSYSQLSNSPASVRGAAILALWGLSVGHGCPLSLPV